MRRRFKAAASRVSVALTLLLGPEAARAGAWPQAPGETLAIATAAAKTYNGINENEFDLYAEHGLKKDWTLVGGVRGWSRLDAQNTFIQAGVRRQSHDWKGFTLASEARVMSGRDWNECGGWGLETRVLTGFHTQVFKRDAFVDIEGAARTFDDGCAEVRLESNLGSAPPKGPGFLLQLNAERVFGGFDRGAPLSRVQAQASALYGLNERLKLQIGARLGYEDTGRRETAVLVGIWRKF